MADADGFDGGDVGHGDGLAAAGVVGDGQHDQRNFGGALGGDQGLQRGDIHVAFEIEAGLRVAGFGQGEIHGARAGEFHVGAGGVEVGIRGDDVAGLAHDGEEDAFGGASLVGGDHVTEAGELVSDALQAEEAFAAGVAFVAAHDGGPLRIGHGAGAGVGEQIDQNISGVDEEEIVAGLGEKALAFRGSGVMQRFHALNAEGFNDGTHEAIIAVGERESSLLVDGDLDAIALNAIGRDVEFGGAGVIERWQLSSTT